MFTAGLFCQSESMKLNPSYDSQAITPADLAVFQRTLSILKEQSGHATHVLYTRLFEYDSSLKLLCPQDVPARTNALLDTLDEVLDSLRSGGNTARQLQYWARIYPVYARNNYYHLYFGAAMFSMLEEVLGSMFTSAVYAAWYKVYEQTVRQLNAAVTEPVPAMLESRIDTFAHATAA